MKRITSLDLAKGFTVIMIAPIHIVMMYSNHQVQYSILGSILAFIAEGPGAQLFILLMGVGMTFSTRLNAKSVFKRTFLFLIAAYGLNTAKFIIPYLFGGIPQTLLVQLPPNTSSHPMLFFLLMGDILHFVIFAYPLTYLLYRQKNYPYLSGIFAFLIIIVSPFLWDLKSSNPLLNYVLTLIGGHPPYVFFPLFPWLVYPLAGLTLGYYLHQNDKSLTLKHAGFLGLIMITLYWSIPSREPAKDWLPFYRTGSMETIAHLGIVLVWLWIFDIISNLIPANSFFKLLIFCSKNITSIYIIQWIIICWCMPFIGYQVLGFSQTPFFIFSITTVTLLLSLAYAKKKYMTS